MIRKNILMFALSIMHISILLICTGCSDDDNIAIQDIFCAQEAENVEDYEAVLNAKVPSNYVDAFRFELFTSSDMSEPIAYDIVSVDELPNSLEGITYIKMHISLQNNCHIGKLLYPFVLGSYAIIFDLRNLN